MPFGETRTEERLPLSLTKVGALVQLAVLSEVAFVVHHDLVIQGTAGLSGIGQDGSIVVDLGHETRIVVFDWRHKEGTNAVVPALARRARKAWKRNIGRWRGRWIIKTEEDDWIGCER